MDKQWEVTYLLVCDNTWCIDYANDRHDERFIMGNLRTIINLLSISRWIDNIHNYVLMKYYHVTVGKNFRCNGKMIIQGHGKYSFGDNVWVIAKEAINPVGGVQPYFRHWMAVAFV